MPKTKKPNLSEQDKRDIVFLAGCALQGILSDHQHHSEIKGLDCAESTCEWSTRYAFETLLRIKQKFNDFEKGPVTFPKHVRAYKRRYDKDVYLANE